MGDLQTDCRWEIPNLTWNQPQPLGAAEFLAAVEKQLLSQANAEQWIPRIRELANHFPHGLESLHGLVESPNARKDHFGSATQVILYTAIKAQKLDGLFDGTDVVDAVVEDDDQSIFPFVETVPRRSVTRVASNNARPKPLKMASHTW